jgi:2-iminobutanoate/2-iminopropanoate deaminase
MTDASAATRKAIASRVLPAPRFLYTPVLQAGPFVFISGMVAIDPGTNAFAGGDASQQTARILANLQLLLDEQGWAREHIVLARLFVADFAAFPGVNQAWEAFFKGVQTPPARTSAGVNALPLNALVEIEFQLLPPT